jgi:TusA-related sulfurtransferase
VDALAPGGALEIWLGDDGRESVPEGLAALGHEVLERADAGDALRLVVRRRKGTP